MGPRPLLGLAVGWLLVVLVVAAVTFVVVDRAGRGVGQASAARTVAPVPTARPAPPGSSGDATPTRAPTPTPARARTASFTTAGGTVVASCAAGELTFESITPFDGWRFEKETEHGGLEVSFRPRADGDDEVELILGCVDGVPVEVAR